MITSRETIHKPVLLKEIITSLNLSKNSIVVDGTFGGGGHSREIAEKYPDVKIIAIDQDKEVFEKFENNWREKKYKISFHNLNFRKIDEVLKKERLEKVNGIILDLGLSSDQLENGGRGFSFMKDEPLLMTMKKNPRKEETTAFDVVNSWNEKSLADVIYGYGEERFAKKIARGIVETRKEKEIKTTKELVAIIWKAIPPKFRKGKIHFATKTFQALRIAVNDELGALLEGLEKGFDCLSKKGRISIISFHSLEDRIVKRFFKEKEKKGEAILINKKPIQAKEGEIKINPRSRSAKLRVLEKII